MKKFFIISPGVKKIMKTLFIVLIIIGILIFISSLLILHNISSYGEKYIISIDELPDDADAILVLGAGLTSEGKPSDILVDRLSTSLKISKEKNCNKFILSGDHGRDDYNEVGAMKKYLIDQGVDESNIFMDHAGFNTYDSMYRAKEIFEANKLIIVTNSYHLPRALYISRNLGIESFGISSDIRNYWNMFTYKLREKLAQLKDFFYVKVLKPEPTFLGDPIPVNSSDGRETNDQ